MLCASAVRLQFNPADDGEQSPRSSEVVCAIRALLGVADGRLDYADSKIKLDLLVDPSFDSLAVLKELDELTNRALELCRGDSRPAFRLGAVRRLLYDAGSWNDYRPFSYDMNDPQGRLLRNKLLHNYLTTRKGQCVSMPVLFLILARRLGLNVALTSAPEHLLVRYTDGQSRSYNIETTSGGHPAREEWVRQNHPITDRSIETGIYLRTLSPREGIAAMASTVVEHLYAQARFEQVISVCEIILHHHPRDVAAMLWLGSASGKLLEQFQERYARPGTAPPRESIRASKLATRNAQFFALAENLGWVPSEQE